MARRGSSVRRMREAMAAPPVDIHRLHRVAKCLPQEVRRQGAEILRLVAGAQGSLTGLLLRGQQVHGPQGPLQFPGSFLTGIDEGDAGTHDIPDDIRQQGIVGAA